MAKKLDWRYKLIYFLMRTIARALYRADFRGREKLPATGGYLLASNHVTELDSVAVMDFILSAKVAVRALSKAELFQIPVVGWAARAAKQIPVYRDGSRPGETINSTIAALQAGEAVLIFPEATLTRDPELWPMKAKPGIGKAALSARVPVVPIAQWGAQDILAPYTSRPRILPRKAAVVMAGDPIDLSDLYERADDPAAATIATERVMSAIREMLGQLRQETPPANVYDMEVSGDRYGRKKKPQLPPA